MTNESTEPSVERTLFQHFPDGIWFQPHGEYAGYCRCGFRISGRDGAEAEMAWSKHLAETISPQPATSREAVATIPAELFYRAELLAADMKDQPDYVQKAVRNALAPAPAAGVVRQAFLEGAADGREAMRLSDPWDIEEAWARSEALRAAQVRGGVS